MLGGIFHDDNYESEIAFRYTVERINMHERNFELIPLVRHVSRTDSFRAERIGEAIKLLQTVYFSQCICHSTSFL